MLVDRYHAPVLRLAYRLTRDPEDPKDIAQDAFLRAFRAWGTFVRSVLSRDGCSSSHATRRSIRSGVAAARLQWRPNSKNHLPSSAPRTSPAGGGRSLRSDRFSEWHRPLRVHLVA